MTDWIGTDSRTAQGGNGDWDRTAATTPTYMTLSLGGLPEGTYDWLSYHHDTENIWSDFQVEISKDGGSSYVFLADKQMTDSTPGGAPDSLRPYVGVDDGAGDNPNPALLPSTFKTSFTVGAADNIVFRFAEYIDGVDPVDTHKLFFAMNGFELTVAGQQLIDGDVNGDRVVTLADFEIIRDHFMMSTTQRTEGDLNFDGVVSWEDFRQWKLNVPGGAPNVANVPEPASLAIACLGLLGLAARRRR